MGTQAEKGQTKKNGNRGERNLRADASQMKGQQKSILTSEGPEELSLNKDTYTTARIPFLSSPLYEA